MNNIYRSIWNDKTGTFVAVSENAGSAGKKSSSRISVAGAASRFGLKALSLSVMLAFGANVHASPVGGVVVEGGASINSGATTTTINQSTQNTVINWKSFNIAQGQTVQFVQPNASSVALNRVISANPSSILGTLSANGKVFLVNPNGILFGQGASVNVGGLVASTLNITNSNFMAGNYTFTGDGAGSVLNQGTINASGGYVALLGANVSNQGVISANLGTVALAAGNAMTLDMAGDGLLNVTVNQGAVNALVENGGLIRADGGRVLMTTQGAGSLLQTAVNNTGVIQAQTIENRNGTILLLGDMQSGTVNVAGTLDASAPNGGNGGFIETSAAHVKIHDGKRVTTVAASGSTGNWLIDPQDYTIGVAPGDDITGAQLSADLVFSNITITTSALGVGNGDIHVNSAVVWNAATTLTLNALRDINVNNHIRPTNGSIVMTAVRDVNVQADLTAINGNISICCGRDINVESGITTTSGSILLGAGRNLNVNVGLLGGAITATDGNITMCAAENINVNGAITLTRGTAIPALSLGLPLGLVLSAGYGASAPGIGAGTLVIAPGAPQVTVTGPNAPATINYNPVAYTSPTDYLPNFTLSGGATLEQNMYVFANVTDKTFDGTTTASLAGLKGAPAGVTLVEGPGSTALFDTAAIGTNKIVNYTGYSLAGANATNYALAVPCCGPVVAKTTGNIVAAAVVPVVPVVPPGTTGTTPLVTSPVPVTPYVAIPYTSAPPYLLFTSPDIPLTVVSADIPSVAVVEETPQPIAVPPAALPPPVEAPPKPFVAPERQPKQDRN
ncbi:MAG: filamentous hemagglutinin [Burkholderiales bacterium RIFCSPLOWO2_02_FULL_57_36]|nr:MAG: filamentous hemagglutinin [Burkholderiales bacterium RIFCSPLOWO2_02_FULL_57_36]